MGAIKAICPIGEAGILATQAGHDLLLVCHDPKAQKEVYYKLLDAYKSQQLPLKALEESAARIRRLKLKRAQRFAEGEPGAEPAGANQADSICRESVQVVQDERKLLPLPRGEASLGVILPRFSALDAKIMIEREVLQEPDFVRNEFKKFGFNPEIHIISIDPADAEIQPAVALARKSDVTILFCYDAHLYPGDKKLLDAIQTAAPKLVVDLLRDPYDAAFIQAGNACLTDFGWRACQIKAAIEKICSAHTKDQ
jgi:beta-N-acetylhexosaminidase